MGRFVGQEIPMGGELYGRFAEHATVRIFMGSGRVRGKAPVRKLGKGFDPLDYVYFISAPEVRRIKIGFSATNPDSRFRTIQSNSPCGVKPLGIIRGDRKYEDALHRVFAPLRALRRQCEWYEADPRLVGFIEHFAVPWPDPSETPPCIMREDGRRRRALVLDAIEAWADRNFGPVYGEPLQLAEWAG